MLGSNGIIRAHEYEWGRGAFSASEAGGGETHEGGPTFPFAVGG